MEKSVEKANSFLNEKKSGQIKLSEDDKKYLWSKIEYKKKKKATESENDLHDVLTSSGNSTISDEQMVKFLNSLEFSAKKQMKDSEKVFKNKTAQSLKDRIPASWIN